MYQDSNMLASIRKVEAAREENAKLDPRRMTAEEKDTQQGPKGSTGTGGTAGG